MNSSPIFYTSSLIVPFRKKTLETSNCCKHQPWEAARAGIVRIVVDVMAGLNISLNQRHVNTRDLALHLYTRPSASLLMR